MTTFPGITLYHKTVVDPKRKMMKRRLMNQRVKIWGSNWGTKLQNCGKRQDAQLASSKVIPRVVRSALNGV